MRDNNINTVLNRISLIKGFLPDNEARALAQAYLATETARCAVEIGSWCGKSSVLLGSLAKARGGVVFAVDHHRGSEENQPDWEEYFDPDTWDAAAGKVDTLPHLRRNLLDADLEGVVIPVVGPSATIAKFWAHPIDFLFIDGGHTMGAALADYRGWTPHVRRGGTLAIHDVFPDPNDGGRPPFEIYQRALASDLFEETGAEGSMRFLRRV